MGLYRHIPQILVLKMYQNLKCINLNLKEAFFDTEYCIIIIL